MVIHGPAMWGLWCFVLNEKGIIQSDSTWVHIRALPLTDPWSSDKSLNLSLIFLISWKGYTLHCEDRWLRPRIVVCTMGKLCQYSYYNSTRKE